MASDVEAMWNLFVYWTSLDGLAFGTVGKLLHIKWPDFAPITDSEFLGVYRDRAVTLHNATPAIRESLGDRRDRTTTANVRAYWMAFREDLTVSSEGLSQLRDLLEGWESDEPEISDHAKRLAGLTNLRLLDALVWGRGTGRLQERCL